MFECYFLKIGIAYDKHCKKMHNNLRIELMQWQAHRLRGSLVDNKKSLLWPRKKNLENETKM